MNDTYSDPDKWVAEANDKPRKILNSWGQEFSVPIMIYSPQFEGDYFVISKKHDNSKLIYQILEGADWEPLMREVAKKLRLKLESLTIDGENIYHLVDADIGARLGSGFVDEEGFFIEQWQVNIDVEKGKFTDEITWGNIKHVDKKRKNHRTTHSWKIY